MLKAQVVSGARRVVLFHGQEHAPGYLSDSQWIVVPQAVAVAEPIPVADFDLDCDAVLLTSKAAALWYCKQSFPDQLVVTSGEGTAAILSAAGKVGIAPKDGVGAGAALRLLSKRLRVGARILFPCGERTAGIAEQVTTELGFELRTLPVYRLQALPTIGPLGTVHAACFGSGQIVEFTRNGLGPARWRSLSSLPALVLGNTARNALSDWNGCVLDLEKTAIQPGSFCIPFALTDEIVSQSTPILDVGC